MKYALFIRDFGESKLLNIKEVEFISIQNAKQVLNFISQYEETYDILISNYLEFEKEILILTAEHMIYRHDEDFFYQIRMQLNKRHINILTVIRLYQDSISCLIPQSIADRDKIKREFKGFFPMNMMKVSITDLWKP